MFDGLFTGASKSKPVVLSKTNCVPLNAVMLALKVHQLSSSPLFSRGEVILKDVTIQMNPFSSVVDAEGGKVHECALNGHYEADGIGCRMSYHFAASILVRLYENGKAPRVAYEGWHELTLAYSKFRVLFEDKGRLKLAALQGQDIVGSWHHSDDFKRLDELGLPERLENYLYALRIRTLGHLKQWKRSQIVENMDDVSLRAALDISVEELGVKLKAED